MYVTPRSFLQCISHKLEFSNVCHTTQFSPIYVTQPRILQCISHHPVISNVCHTVQVMSPAVISPAVMSPVVISSKRTRNCSMKLKSIVGKPSFLRARMSLIYISSLVFPRFLAVFKYTYTETCLNTLKKIRKCWKTRQKTVNAISRKCQKFSWLWAYRWGSQSFSVCELQTYMIEDT